MDKNGLTLIEVIVSFSILMIFVGSIFTMLGYVSKNNSIHSMQLTQSNILHSAMEEVKVKMKLDVNIRKKENTEYIYAENGKDYVVEKTVTELTNKKELYKIFIEIKNEDHSLKDGIVSYYFDLISYEPQYYSEIPITPEDIYGLNFKTNDE